MIVGDRKLMTRDGKKRQKKLSASQQLAAFAGHVQRVGSAWLLECRQRNRPFWRMALLWTYMYFLQRQCVSLLLNFLNRSIWVHVVRIKESWVMMTETDWYDATIYLERISDWNSHCVSVLWYDRGPIWSCVFFSRIDRKPSRHLLRFPCRVRSNATRLTFG